MSFYVLVLLMLVIGVYWVMTQVMPERKKDTLLRPGLGEALLSQINEQRHERGLPILEADPDLFAVAEGKATHEIMTGLSDEGWDYPPAYEALFGRSLLMEALVTGPATRIVQRLSKQKDLFDGEWIYCGIGVAGGRSDQLVVAIVLCREAWEPVAEVTTEMALSL